MPVGEAIVGRGGELSLVAAALSSPSDAVLLMVAGEPGIGKTRLIEAGVHRVRAEGRVVLRGWCLDLWTQLPLLPFVDIVRDLASWDEGRVFMAALAACPTYVERELHALLPEFETVQQLDAGVGGEVAGWRQERMFGALSMLLSAAADVCPVALVIEDAHWADRSTQDLLRYLVAPSHRCGAPVVLTARTETDRIAWLRDLADGEGVDWLDLGPLSDGDAAALVQRMGERSASEVRRIIHRAGGNPLFVEQLAGLDHGTGLPATLAVSFARQLTDLDATEREVVQALAVVGRPVDDGAMGALIGQHTVGLGAALRSLVVHRLVDRTDADEYKLHHALLADAVRAQMTAADAGPLHARAAAVLAARDDPSIAGDVADHFAAVGKVRKEARWRLRAASYADSIGAAVEAVRQWQHLIEISRRDEALLSALDITLVDLYLSTFSALDRANRGGAAAQLAQEALRRLPPVMDAADEVRVYYEVGRWRQVADPQQGLELLEHAIAVGERHPVSREYVRALNQVAEALNYVRHGDYAGQEEFTTRALRAAQEAELRAEEKLAMVSLGWRAMATGDRERAVDLVERGLAITVDPPDPATEVVVGTYATDTYLKVGDLDEVIATGIRVLHAARLAGFPHTFECVLVTANVVEALRERGKTRELAPIVMHAAEDPFRKSTAVAHSDVAALRLLVGDLDSAGRFWAESAQMPDFGLEFDREFCLLRDDFLLWAGRAVEVVPDALPVLEALSRTEESVFAGGLLVLAMRACADRAVSARATGDPAALAAALADGGRLTDLVTHCLRDPFPPNAVPATGPADLASWHAETERLHGRADIAAWAVAADAWEALARPHRAGYARWRQAEALLADPTRRGAAAPVLRAAAAQAREHAPLTAAIEQLARRAHIEVLDERPPVPPVVERPFGLTDRELGVLELLGDGLTNGEIGARLFMSPRTASVHVSSILRKMQVTSRVQAAAVAAHRGLVGVDPPVNDG